jgi:hypothetical protein
LSLVYSDQTPKVPESSDAGVYYRTKLQEFCGVIDNCIVPEAPLSMSISPTVAGVCWTMEAGNSTLELPAHVFWVSLKAPYQHKQSICDSRSAQVESILARYRSNTGTELGQFPRGARNRPGNCAEFVLRLLTEAWAGPVQLMVFIATYNNHGILRSDVEPCTTCQRILAKPPAKYKYWSQ